MTQDLSSDKKKLMSKVMFYSFIGLRVQNPVTLNSATVCMGITRKVSSLTIFKEL